jgi:hypothetical protein
MFGLALRTYRRKVQRFSESETLAGRSLWEAVHEFLKERDVTNHSEVLARFHRDDEQIVRGVLQDLVDSGLVFRSGRGASSSYRGATRADLEHARSSARDPDGVDMLVWAVVYRLGPIDRGKLAAHVSLPERELEEALARLVAAARLVRTSSGPSEAYRADTFVAPLGDSRGWEAAVFDHFQAVVTTICGKLGDSTPPMLADKIGGSTYTFEVWPGHSLEQEVLAELGNFRTRMARLRDRVVAENRRTGVPRRREKVVIYGGQNVVEHEDEDEDADG